ncbi:MAG: NADH-quinone oxidoreductase subunit NuoK [Candidatus Hodarchaeales archaeon]|jgi:NADH:ubiquinone oxidoreductase subunit K
MALETFTDFEVILVLSFVMLLIGIYGLIAKKNAIKVIMALEIMVSAPNLAFIAFGFAQGQNADPTAQAFVIIALAVGAAVIGLALAFMRNLWKHFGTTDVGDYTTLKG